MNPPIILLRLLVVAALVLTVHAQTPGLENTVVDLTSDLGPAPTPIPRPTPQAQPPTAPTAPTATLRPTVVPEPVPQEAFVVPAPTVDPVRPAVTPRLPIPLDSSLAASRPTTVDSISPELTVPGLSVPIESAVEANAVLVDEEGDFLADTGSSLLNFISPTDPNGRDNFTVSVGTSLGYDTNVLYSPNQKIASATATLSGSLGFAGGTPRFEVRTRLDLRSTNYQERPGGKQDNSVLFSLGARYQAQERLVLDLTTVAGYQSVPDTQLLGGSFALNGSFLFADLRLSATYQLRPRLSLSFAYSFNSIKYDDEIVDRQSGFTSQVFSLSTNYLLSPTTSFLTEYRYNPVSYSAPGQATTGQIFLVGLSRSFSPRFNATMRAGAEFRAIENPNTDLDAPTEYIGPFVEGEANYNLGLDSELISTLRFGTEPSGVSGITIRQSFRMSLGIEKAIGKRLSARASVNFLRDNFDQPGLAPDSTQDVYSGILTLRYQFNPSIATVLSYDYLLFKSSVQDADYDRSFSSFGLEVNF